MPRLRLRLWWAERSSSSSSPPVYAQPALRVDWPKKSCRSCLFLFVTFLYIRFSFFFNLWPWILLFARRPSPPSMLDWRLRNGIGCVWRHVAGQHVCPGLLGQRDPEAHHQPAGRGRGVFRDKDRVVWQEHFILASELFRSWAAV